MGVSSQAVIVDSNRRRRYVHKIVKLFKSSYKELNMKKNICYFLIILFFLLGCKKDNVIESIPTPPEKIEVVINDIPFQTEKYYRIPYTLKTWEWEKDGLKLQQIEVLEDNSKLVLMTIAQPDLPFIYKDPLKPNPFFTNDKISNYYLSIQLPILLT